MKIGFLGAGDVAQAFSKHLLGAGHEVVLSNSRGPSSLRTVVDRLGEGASAGTILEAVVHDFVVLAVPWVKVDGVLAKLPRWQGQVLIDATNHFLMPTLDLADLRGQVSSEIVASLAPGARVVKVLNTLVSAKIAADPVVGIGRRVTFLSGDDVGAKADVSALLTDLGFAVIDLGGLHDGGRLQQAGGPLAGQDFILTAK